MSRSLKSLARLVGLIVGLATLPVAAQSERYPTCGELIQLVADLPPKMPALRASGVYRDRRSPEMIRQRDRQVKAWQEQDPAAAPFLGQWSAIEETLTIYPSLVTGRVCLLETYVPGPDSLGIAFTTGVVVDQQIRTQDQRVLILAGGFLGSAFVYQGKPGLYEYANPRPIVDPATVSFWQDHPELLAQFQREGCLTDVPRSR